MHYDNSQLNRIEKKLDWILRLLHLEYEELEHMAQTIDDVQQAVNDEQTVEQSAITLLTQLHDLLVAAQGDPAKIQAIIAQLGTNKEALAAAITANTPGQQPPAV